MKRKLLNLLTVAFIITTIGYVMDGDPTEPMMLTRFMEFFGMLGIVFLIVSFFYFSTTFVIKKMRSV
jgi:hypothetical protein